ncbi:hypothetical protein K2Z83_27075 [Oscillochloris sp. ZM17-4]|uniref:hypothetical protein n=1 Tax=Oscillochloris sp. ZM17-4 TaxID=2866714 RepID=UPI001C733370|nr:hypothetical protein [Oscillochloris sp. ZM17-4]MBX0331318.1 hypothetical protein [Oscillochloris sp. ZM17-4]
MSLKRKPVDIQPFPLWLLSALLFEQKYVYVNDSHLVIEKCNLLYSQTLHISVGSADWLQWIERNSRFNFKNNKTYCLFQKERRGNRYYWYAYKWHTNKHGSERVYVGKLEELSPREITEKAMELDRMAQFTKEEIARRRARAKARTRTRTRRTRRTAQADARRLGE